MKSRSIWMSLVLAAAFIIQPISALAASVSFTPTTDNCGVVSIKMPIKSLGGVEIPRGRVAISNNTIEVTMIPEWMFDRQVALSGPVLRAVSTITGDRAAVVGIAYFQEGPWLKYIDDPNRQDILMTKTGPVTGRILSADSDNIVVQHDGKQESIPLASVQDIRSPRAYTFAIPAMLPNSVPAGAAYQAEATGFALSPTSSSYKLAALKSDLAKESGDWSTSKVVLLGATFSAMELAQLAIPLVYALHIGAEKRTAFAVERNTVSDQVEYPVQPIPYRQLNVLSPYP